MGVRIKRISAKSLGPINEFSEELGLFNLIYSGNELGKTWLVEFIIASLFRNRERWKLREIGRSGKVWLEGLEPELVSFSPSSRRKMEDYWESRGKGLPMALVNLLVAKGAESAIADVEGGIDKYLIRKLLSGKDILDSIDAKISKTVQAATIEGQEIIGVARGEIKERDDLRRNLKQLDLIFDEIDSLYSGGLRQALTIEKEKFKSELSGLDKAKRYKAYVIDEKLQSLNEEINNISEDEISSISNDMSVYSEQLTGYRQKEDNLGEVRNRCKQYEWLASAKDTYQGFISHEAVKPDKWLLIGPIVSGFLTLVFMLVNQSAAGIIAFLATAVFLLIYIRKLEKAAVKIATNEEIKKLKQEFNVRIGQELTDLAVLGETLERNKADYEKAKVLADQLSREKVNLNAKLSTIENKFRNLLGKNVDSKEWDETISTLKHKLKTTNRQIQSYAVELGRLDVDPSDYSGEDNGLEYSKEKYEDVQFKLNAVKQNIDEEYEKLNRLKAGICQVTGNELTVNWELIIDNLQKEYNILLKDFKKISAQIIGDIAVHQVIEALREEEDSKIMEGLESDSVQKPLHDITGRYNKITLNEDIMIVSDDFNDFTLSDMSTGAMEQIMLALRIGFSLKLLKKDSLFLILDDAFQHSDWQHREMLVNRLAALARDGWQILYLSMDDHIKDLFDKSGEAFGCEYKSIVIEDS